MAKQVLGTLTVTRNPGEMTIIRPDLSCAYVLTYTNVGYFDWGASIIGKVITLKWNAQSTSDFESLHDLWEAGSSIVFNPQDGENKTYNVQILSVEGEYLIGIGTSGLSNRKNIVVKLLIMSQV